MTISKNIEVRDAKVIRLLGTGLGLATVYAIGRKHAGFIRTESEPGKGSEFALHLPLRRPPR